MNRKRFPILLSTLAFVLIGRIALSVVTPVFDPSEGRYAAICANMDRTGDFLVPSFTHKGVYRSFDGKPPLVFQAGGWACRVFGRNELAVRLPGIVSGLFILLFVYRFTKNGKGREAGLVAAGVCLTCTAFLAATGFCMTDIPLSACVAGAILLEARFHETGRRLHSLGVFALLGLGMLIKGPVALALFGLPVTVDAFVNRRWKAIARHSWFLGLALFFLIAAPWYVLMERQNPGFLEYFFIHENLLRFLVHDYGDKYGAGRETFRGMAILWAIVVTLPWTPFVLFAPRHRLRSLPAVGVLTITGFWCLTSRVPLAYLLPVVPLFAVWIVLETEDLRRFERLLPYAGGASLALLALTLTITTLASDKMPGHRFRRLLEKHPRAKIAFPRKQPYSAEFYLGGHLTNDATQADIVIERHHGRWEVTEK